jgi:hypothetical protein
MYSKKEFILVLFLTFKVRPSIILRLMGIFMLYILENQRLGE